MHLKGFKMTQKEIARALNVSVATVSLALRDSALVNSETKGKVKRFASMARYRPNLNARSLLFGKTFTIGILVPDMLNPFYAGIVEEIYLYLKKRHYLGIFIPAETEKESEEALEILLNRKVDGVILISYLPLEKLIKLREEGVPVVAYNKRDVPVDCVDGDKYGGGVKATKHLVGLGHTKIAFIGVLHETERRFTAYKDTLNRHGIVLKQEWLIPGIGSVETGYKGMRKILSQKSRPTAVFAFNDMVALGVTRAAVEAGLSIPGDLAVVGFDNLRDAAYWQVSLTTVDQPKEEIARSLVDILLNRVENGKEKENFVEKVIATKLVIRESCGYKAPQKNKQGGGARCKRKLVAGIGLASP